MPDVRCDKKEAMELKVKRALFTVLSFLLSLQLNTAQRRMRDMSFLVFFYALSEYRIENYRSLGAVKINLDPVFIRSVCISFKGEIIGTFYEMFY